MTEGYDLDLLLWFRDALGLVVLGDDVPPRAVPRSPDRSDQLADDERVAAAGRWAAWWRAALAFAGESQRAEAPAGKGQFLAWVHERAVVHEAIGVPPDFAALSDVPSLRDAVVRLFADARRDLSGREAARAGALPRRATAEDHRGLAALAEDVARAHGVGIGAVRGAVLVVAVEGPWWRLVGPGVVVCSSSAYGDDAAFTSEVVRAAFVSALRA
ncbi:hypothetical protein [Cellulosimicrobium protaetiae]|uniref:Uncharacterized protein n=1 Tax=Cellulosimicrobium protaetiae TaxID=2587808 RepID=A0A6M5UIG7_9MICO|nr:hypothetical protein [Cellulosimicrobium protaetiae]QJW36449.1 hypothetical protein FIC82_009845 [Cellulosimicrobium protaetiae]